MNRELWRRLLYISRAPDRRLLQLLPSRGWDVTTVDCVGEAERCLAEDGPTAGLFDFSSGYSAIEIDEFEVCLMARQMNWVGSLFEHQLTDLAMRRAIRNYFFDFVTVPSEAERLLDAIGHAHGMAQLEGAEPAVFAKTEMIGNCEAMQQLFKSIDKVAHSDAPVLIYGESGTGKELTAREIHNHSLRRDGPFVAINCGAIPHHLVQSELYGYERGAFTGAHARKIGYIEAATGGTLFLDEIGDLPLESQASLLRFLQERKIQRLGSTEPIAIETRIISATHHNLEDSVKAGTFRADLYHRLCVLRLEEPPLRLRGSDIEILAYHVLERFRTESRRRIRGFSAAAVKAMYSYHWPGNVREMINRVRRAIVMTEENLITPTDLELEQYVAMPGITLIDAREAAEREVIERALRRHRNRLNEAAQELGISRTTLYRLMLSHGLRNREERLARADLQFSGPGSIGQDEPEIDGLRVM
ncbi:MAG: sigma 54-interacting transcriptional regulator [Janthinobacterium lividum]